MVINRKFSSFKRINQRKASKGQSNSSQCKERTISAKNTIKISQMMMLTCMKKLELVSGHLDDGIALIFVSMIEILSLSKIKLEKSQFAIGNECNRLSMVPDKNKRVFDQHPFDPIIIESKCWYDKKNGAEMGNFSSRHIEDRQIAMSIKVKCDRKIGKSKHCNQLAMPKRCHHSVRLHSEPE